jgi:hypothetical protein
MIFIYLFQILYVTYYKINAMTCFHIFTLKYLESNFLCLCINYFILKLDLGGIFFLITWTGANTP